MAYRDFKKTEIIEEIGLEMRKLRNSKKVTLAVAADRLHKKNIDLSSTMLGRIETGDRRVDDPTLKAICELYDADFHELLIAATKKHLETLQQNQIDLRKTMLKSEDPSDEAPNFSDLRIFYESLNTQGKKEFASVMNLMTYMTVFKQ